MQNSNTINRPSVNSLGNGTGPIVAGPAARGDTKLGSANVAHDFHTFLVDIEDLIKDMATLTGDDLAQARNKLSSRIEAAKVSAEAVGSGLSQRAKQTAETSNNYVHEKPWTVVGASAAIAFVLGLLTARRG
ncbi:DUF883 family protein [Pseudomonas sp. EA_35y_Pfl2_R111]|uniref:DUF883 family protein n=1 Tax=Pseudomonas sp. EA_35y_Pfl2_R111 TaxID=3088689 RepID=UPI0030DC88B5